MAVLMEPLANRVSVQISNRITRIELCLVSEDEMLAYGVHKKESLISTKSDRLADEHTTKV